MILGIDGVGLSTITSLRSDIDRIDTAQAIHRDGVRFRGRPLGVHQCIRVDRNTIQSNIVREKIQEAAMSGYQQRTITRNRYFTSYACAYKTEIHFGVRLTRLQFTAVDPNDRGEAFLVAGVVASGLEIDFVN